MSFHYLLVLTISNKILVASLLVSPFMHLICLTILGSSLYQFFFSTLIMRHFSEVLFVFILSEVHQSSICGLIVFNSLGKLLPLYFKIFLLVTFSFSFWNSHYTFIGSFCLLNYLFYIPFMISSFFHSSCLCALVYFVLTYFQVHHSYILL
jgi:hypothetical protein